MYASKEGHYNQTKTLLSFDADVHQKDKNGCSAGVIAQKNEHSKVATVLINHGSGLTNATRKASSYTE